MTNQPDSGTRGEGAKRRLRQGGLDTGAFVGDGLSLAGVQRPSEHSMRQPAAPLVPPHGAVLLLILLLASTGCVRPLAVQDEYFAPASESGAQSLSATRHLVSHHRALQVAQHSCSAVRTHSGAPPGNLQPSAGPEIGNSAAGEALRRLCASGPPRLPVSAHGASFNAYRRWVQDAVRELPEASRTAASAAGGS